MSKICSDFKGCVVYSSFYQHLEKKSIVLTFATVLVEVHGDGEIEVFRTEGPVGVMWLD